MKKRWYVIGENDNLTSYSAKKEEAEFFTTRSAANKRAVELANAEPRQIFYICETVGFADAEVTPATYKTI